MSDGYAQLVAYLSQRESKALLWGSPHVESSDPVLGRFYSSWVDIYVPDVIQACEFGWVWTVESLKDSGKDEVDMESSFFTIDLDYDLTVHSVWDPYATERTSDAGKWFEPGEALSIALPLGQALSTEQSASIAEALGAGPDRRLYTFGGWTEAAVNAAVATWCLTHTGQAFTVEFEPSQEFSGHAAKAAAALEALKAGEETYLVGVGENGVEIQASPEAFDSLMQLPPERAAEAMEMIQRFASDLTRDQFPRE